MDIGVSLQYPKKRTSKYPYMNLRDRDATGMDSPSWLSHAFPGHPCPGIAVYRADT